MDIIKEKIKKYAPKMELENIALLGFALISISMLIGLFVPKKLKTALRLCCICVASVDADALAITVWRLENETKEEECED